MLRPFKVSYGRIVGPAALAFSIGIALQYMPDSPAVLVWPYEWALVHGWIVLGAVFYVVGRKMHDAGTVFRMLDGMKHGYTQVTNT